MKHATRKVQNAINEMVEWSYDWGYKFSVEKRFFFTREKKSEEGLKVRTYGKDLDRVSNFKFLGVLFDS